MSKNKQQSPDLRMQWKVINNYLANNKLKDIYNFDITNIVYNVKYYRKKNNICNSLIELIYNSF